MNNWPLNPLISGDWRDLSKLELVDFAQLFGSMSFSQFRDLDVELLDVRVMPLTCYPNTLLVEVHCHWPQIEESALFNCILGNNGLSLVDGKSAVIHALRSDLELDDAAKARAYVDLFCSTVHGPEGRFRLVQHEMDLSLQDATKLPRGVQQLIARGIVIAELDGGDGWKVQTVLQYDDRLFDATFEVDSTGAITMESDEQPDDQIRLVPERWQDFFRLTPMQAQDHEGAVE